MSRRVLFVLLLVLFAAGCGGGDPTAELARSHPDAAECLSWKQYVLIRYPEDESLGTVPAILMRLEDEEWVELGRSRKGFISLHEVITYIPEMDESGVEAFGLR